MAALKPTLPQSLTSIAQGRPDLKWPRRPESFQPRCGLLGR
jgi:hypothetical protein